MSDLEFFTSEMNASLERCRARIRAITGLPEGENVRMQQSFAPIETCVYGVLGNGPIQAMADALLSMEMTSWESFYRGYVDWQRSLPECRIPPDMFEENARGAMLMSLRNRIQDLGHRSAKAA